MTDAELQKMAECHSQTWLQMIGMWAPEIKKSQQLHANLTKVFQLALRAVRDASPRVEECCECHVKVSEWVEAEHRNGRICRPCDQIQTLREQLQMVRDAKRGVTVKPAHEKCDRQDTTPKPLPVSGDTELTETQQRLLAFLDSAEGRNFTASQQRDTANRLVDELTVELATERAAREQIRREQSMSDELAEALKTSLVLAETGDHEWSMVNTDALRNAREVLARFDAAKGVDERKSVQ